MKAINKVKLAVILGCVLVSNLCWSQEAGLRQLLEGKKYFWEAKFDRAVSTLRQVVGAKRVRTEHRFEAYLYLGFVLMRQNAPSTEVRSAFEQAIKLDPKREIDAAVIPPDLVARFNRVRDSLVGCIYVTSEPLDVEFVVVYEDSVLYSLRTPSLVCEVTNRSYELLVTDPQYMEQFSSLPLTAGKVDTLSVKLVRDSSHEKGQKAWTWFARGGIVATAFAVLYKTVLEGGATETEILPGPPGRP